MGGPRIDAHCNAKFRVVRTLGSDVQPTIQLNVPTSRPTATQPAINPIQDVAEGMGISNPNAVMSMRRGGAVTPSGIEHG